MALVWDKTLFDDMYRLYGWRDGVLDNSLLMFHYHWWAARPMISTQLAALVQQPGWASVQKIGLIGDGFGWLAEELEALGIEVVVNEISDFILNNRNVSEEQELRDALAAQGFNPDSLPPFRRADGSIITDHWNPDPQIGTGWLRVDGARTSAIITSEDLTKNGGRNTFNRQFSGNQPDALVTTYAIDAQETDAESLAFAEMVQATRKNPAQTIVHLVQDTPGDPGDPRMNVKTKEQWKAFLAGTAMADHRFANDQGEWV